jgi:DNA-binding CsgD family transcriptional regulator/tetratricopeptide (TPR) repeat protein
MLVGRDAERAAIDALLDGARASRGGTLVLRGEPGIGKTALLEDARNRATGMRVLGARGVESESELPFASLHQLLRPVLNHLERLPAPQEAALRGALGLDRGEAEERFLVSAACLSLLSEIAERRPVLCLVDDAHWLDSASADALLFAARRLDADRVAILFAAREGDVRGFETGDVPSLVVAGLDDETSATLLSRVAREAVEPVRRRLIEQARGNALALVELPTALSAAQLAGHEPLPEALPLTRHLESIFLERVHRLTHEAQYMLLLAAANDTEDAILFIQAAEVLGADPWALDTAEHEGLVIAHGNRLQFRHPVVRSAVYEAASSSRRREVHRALAEALAGDDDHADRRAWHLAASVLEPDEDVVRALEDAAARAEQRAGYMAAARAFARAAELSSDRQARGRRLVRAARAARIAGADDYAVVLVRRADPLVDDVLLEAELALAVGSAECRRGRPMDGLPRLLEAAGKVAKRDPAKAVELLIWATGAASVGGDPAARAEVSRLAEEIVAAGGDDEAVSVAQALAAHARARDGDTSAGAARLEDAYAWAATSDDAQHVYMVSLAAIYLGDNQRFATLINRATSLARARGEFGILVEALSMSASQHHVAQRFDEAALAAGEALRFARELGAANATATPLGILAFAAAIRGDDDEARRQSGEMLELAAAHGLSARATYAVYVLGMVELGRGRWAEALEHFRVVADPRPDVGDAFLAKGAVPDIVEAALRAGHPGEAREALSAFEEWAPDSSYPWVQARLSSCRALLADGEEATAHHEEALRLGAEGGPFDLARIRLLYGEHLRRERRRNAARMQLRAALEGFERLRAEPWAERTRRELRASGETTRRRDPSTLDQLTPQELQISRFVAQGLANKEVAAQLFISPRTVDHHLRNVFAKLGITSRLQLAGLPLGKPEPTSFTPPTVSAPV